MEDREWKRRRSPLWVRDMPSNSLHGLALRLMRDGESEDLSDAQEWLWSACISELEYRHRSAPKGEQRCACMLCIPPFVD